MSNDGQNDDEEKARQRDMAAQVQALTLTSVLAIYEQEFDALLRTAAAERPVDSRQWMMALGAFRGRLEAMRAHATEIA